MPFGEHARGLFDQDPIVQRPLQLLSEDFLLFHRALLEQADRGDARQPLAQGDVLLGSTHRVDIHPDSLLNRNHSGPRRRGRPYPRGAAVYDRVD